MGVKLSFEGAGDRLYFATNNMQCVYRMEPLLEAAKCRSKQSGGKDPPTLRIVQIVA
jgi:hypothetical protein